MSSDSVPKPRLLIADDQPDVRQALGMLFRSEGYAVELVASPDAVESAVRTSEFDAVLADLNYSRDTTSGAEGLELIRRLAAMQPELPVIVMTAWGTIELAVEAMRLGARNFVEKPWDNAKLTSLVRNQVELCRALRRSARLEAENALLRGESVEEFVAASAAMRPVVDMIRKIAPSDANVLITGEPGTGKSLLARLIHENSARAKGAFVAVNMGGIPETMFESEMFGHVRGAFTDAKSDRTGRFELADNGSLFLDEIGNIPFAQQAKLLRVLEDGQFERIGSSRTQRADVRVISATNADLRAAIEAGEFRKDLLFRLNTVEIRIPALRERRDDILPLAQLQLDKLKRKYKCAIAGFEPDAAEWLRSYAWPGNVRELSHVIERAVLLCESPKLRLPDVATLLTQNAPGDNKPAQGVPTLEEAEQELMRRALAHCDGNVIEAADLLGISRSAMYRRIEKYSL
ncbi:MAG TPA: sigma-54 dependent transcriptional regulator [Gammaproteobacteria bacterium]